MKSKKKTHKNNKQTQLYLCEVQSPYTLSEYDLRQLHLLAALLIHGLLRSHSEFFP